MSTTSFIDLNAEDIPELAPTDPGQYELLCTSAELVERTAEELEAGKSNYISLKLKIMGVDTAPSIRYMINLVGPKDDIEKKANKVKWAKSTVAAFGVDHSNEFSVAEFVDKSVWAILEIEQTKNYGPQNRVKEFVTPNA
jgi:hypothetical protein